MAKQKESSFHWFKFNVLRWNTGDIQHVSYHLKGVFSDLMAYYWARQCDVSLAQANKKFKEGNIKNLCEAGIVKIDGEMLVIDFLDEEWAEVMATSLKNSEKAQKRWGKKESSSNATALPGQSQSNANKKREEEIRTEEKRERDPSTPFFRINDQIFLLPPSEYFTTNFASYHEHAVRVHKNEICAAALKKLDNDYFGYQFNDVTHIRNSFKTCLEKVLKERGFGAGGNKPSKAHGILNAAEESARQLGLTNPQQYPTHE